MDLEDTFVSGKTSSDCVDSDYISWDVLDINISEPIGEWERTAYCSPVLEAWGRWENDIKHSVDQALSTFSGNKVRIEQISNYMKGRMINVTPDDLFGLIRLADMLLISRLFNYCKSRIANLPLTKDNFYKILHACTLYDFEHECMDKYIRGNLTELCKLTVFSKIDAESVEMLLTEEELCYWPMESRFNTIQDWCAVNGNVIHFERWFDFINLDKLEEEYLKNVVQSNDFVQVSGKCLPRVNAHLTFRQDEPVPYVFIFNDYSEGSNVVGVNLEDMHLYRFTFPDIIMDTISVPRTKITGEILAFNSFKLKSYDINTGNYKERCIDNGKHNTENISHIVETNEGLVIISTEERKNDDGSTRRKDFGDGCVRRSVLYHAISDNGKVLEIKPLMSLQFEVNCACYNQAMIVMSTSTFPLQSKLYCFSLQTNTMTKIDIIANVSINHNALLEQSMVKSLLPIHDRILVCTIWSYKFLSVHEATGIYNFGDKTKPNLPPPFQGNPRNIVLLDFLVELNEKSVNIYYMSKEQNSFKSLKSHQLKTLNISYDNPITCGYVNKTKPVCHFLCPHCDPNPKEKEEAEIKRQEEEMRERDRNAQLENETETKLEFMLPYYDDSDDYSDSDFDSDDYFDSNDYFDYDEYFDIDDYNDIVRYGRQGNEACCIL